ncbi:GH35 family beta-galactosidase [Lutibacter flavus]|nr:DUF5597 domain-containing protein [Lutibacter flavus]
MNKIYKIVFFSIALFTYQISFCQNQIPHLLKQGKTTQLIVGNQPFLILGGELGNSSATSKEYMNSVWPKIKGMHLNTVLIPIYWELLEPEENNFDFALVDQLILEARKNNMKIVFLWFASWKNSMSSHAPDWVKLNQDRFPRIKDDKGLSHEILTPFSDSNLQADLIAFEKLMQHIKLIDSQENTVIMMQVENEIGMLPTARDYHPLAKESFKKEVPKDLINYLQQHKNKLVPEFFEIWKTNGFKTKGNWESVFGKGKHTDELFMAWYYSKFTNKIIEAGKNMYPLPMFVNAALNRPGKEPGEYPSAGPLPHLMDLWKAAGPTIDFLAPDFYNPRFKHWNDLYVRQGDPLFIPEHKFDKTVAAKSLYAIGHYEALGFSPFSIESTNKPEDEPLGKVYNLLTQITPIISEYQGKDKIEGVLFDKENQEIVKEFGNYEFTFKHDLTLGWNPSAKDDDWPMTGAIIIHTENDEFYFVGTGVVITVKPIGSTTNKAGILKADEGIFENNKWKTIRHLNGDQTHQGRHIRIPFGEYSIQKFKLYTYK